MLVPFLGAPFTTALNQYFRAELGFFDGGPLQVTFTRPDGSVALDALGDLPPQGYRATWVTRRERLNLDRTGTWRLRPRETTTAHLRPEGNRGDDNSATNSLQRRMGVRSFLIRRST